MLPRIEAAEGASAKLRAYIESNLEFMATHRAHLAAVIEIFNALPRDEEGRPTTYAARHERGLVQLEGLLGEGQRTGELRWFSTRVMAVTIRAAVDAVGYRLAIERDLDLAPYASELATLFDRATRADD
jgi:TetR/AcrR family transcriptional regulator, fatty acid metabolism regulator protein